MVGRVSLPAAEDIFRPTGEELERDDAAGKPQSSAVSEEPRHEASRRVRAVPDPTPESVSEGSETAAKKAASGRVRHDEKMTVYVTRAELIDIEQARLTLRGAHGLVVDRGRMVREAVALVLHDLDEYGADSLLVRHLDQVAGE